jgi:Family of unknown function (DUF6152)
VALAVVTCALIAPASAHHSRAAFDTTVEVTIEGVVKNVVWANPHVYMTLEVAGPGGQPATQEVEVGPLSTLRPLGLTQEALATGDRVTVRANPNRAGPGHTVVGLDVTTSDGRVYPLHVFGRARPAPAAQKADGLAGRWVPLTTGLQALVQGARTWPLTDVGRQGVEDVRSQQASQSECSPWPAPLLMALPVMRTIDVSADTITLRFDWMNGLRTVHLNLAEHPAGVAPSPQGHSIGRWDGGALVIDTVGFTPHREGAGFGIPSGASKHLIERLTLDADRATLTYEFTVEDPLSLTEPVTRSFQWTYRPDLEPTGQQCDTGIATRFLRD